MDNIKAAQDLGYEVGLAWESEEEKVYRVSGYGIDTMYSTKTNEDEWKFLVDPKAHEHRVNMFKHNDPEDDFTMTDEEIAASSIAASKSVGSIS